MNDIREMISVVQTYIHIRKGVEIQVNTNNLNTGLLIHMYGIATNYFNSNGIKLELNLK